MTDKPEQPRAGAEDAPTTFPYPYTIIHQIPGLTRKTHYLDGDGAVDGAAVDFDATIINDGATANVLLCKITPSGAKQGEMLLDVRQIEAGAKADSVTAKQSGANLILWIRYHVGDFNPKTIRVVIPGYLWPYPNGVQPLGMEGAFVPGDTPPPPPPASEPVDYERIARLVLDGINEFDRRLGGQGPREDIEGKVKDALREEGVLRAASSADEKYEILRHDTRDGAYEAIVSYFGPKISKPEAGE